MQININADKIKADLKKAWDQQPAIMLAAGATALTGAAKLWQARTNARNSRTYRMEVNRRTKKNVN